VVGVLSIAFAPYIAHAQDALAVNPDVVHLKLENERVRVLESTLAPGKKEKMHAHLWPYVIYVINGGLVRNHLPNGKSVDSELKAGDVIYRDPITHWTENIGATEVRVLVMEMKKQ
jgi:quercetin dioxygenase-like cupin family protein